MITEEKLKQYGFHESNGHLGSKYALEIKIQFIGSRGFIAFHLPVSGWWVNYIVNGIIASDNIFEEEQLQSLYFGVTGIKLF